MLCHEVISSLPPQALLAITGILYNTTELENKTKPVTSVREIRSWRSTFFSSSVITLNQPWFFSCCSPFLPPPHSRQESTVYVNNQLVSMKARRKGPVGARKEKWTGRRREQRRKRVD